MLATPALLEVEDLHMHFPRREGLFGKSMLRALDGVSFALGRGETLGMVGESGCGKSTLVRTLLGLHKPLSGAIRLNGRDMIDLSRRERRETSGLVQVVFQDPYSALDPRMTAHEIVAEPLRINGRYSRQRVSELFGQVGLGREHEGRKPSEFSGGQRQRIGIARALALEPDLLILDEPVSALDASVRAQVINLLQDLQGQLGISYLFIAHDLSVVRHISDRVAVMYLGRIVEIGPRDQVFDHPAHPYTRSLISAVPVPDPVGRDKRSRIVLKGDLPDAANLPSGCRFRTRCPQARAECAAEEPTLAEYSAGDHHAACFFVGQETGQENSSAATRLGHGAIQESSQRRGNSISH